MTPTARQTATARGDGRRAALVAVAVSVVLVTAKAGAVFWTGSLAVGSAALDSLFDVSVSTVNYLVVRRSLAPPDREHHYGHGKFESIAALAQAVLLALLGLALVVMAAHDLAQGAVARHNAVGIAVLAVSAVAGWGLARHLSRAARETGSPALAADAAHYRTDLWVNLAALGALVVVETTGWAPADPLVAVGVSLLVLGTAARLGVDALADLTDRALPDEEIAAVRRIVASFAPEVRGCHDLRTRAAGRHRFVELHLEIPRETSFERAHDLTVQVLEAIESELPRSKVFVHTDPV